MSMLRLLQHISIRMHMSANLPKKSITNLLRSMEMKFERTDIDQI